MRSDAAAQVVRYPQHQWIDLGSIYTFGDVTAGTTMALDALNWSNKLIQTDGAIGRYITFMFLLGPQYARHEIIFTHPRGPDMGIFTPYMAKVLEDVPASAGYHNPRQLIQDLAGHSGALTWVNIGGGHSFYNAAVSRNVCEGLTVRVEGAEGAPFTAVATDSDGFHGINGGPGVYAMQFRMDSKDGASTAYRGAWSEIGVHRIDESGFV